MTLAEIDQLLAEAWAERDGLGDTKREDYLNGLVLRLAAAVEAFRDGGVTA